MKAGKIFGCAVLGLAAVAVQGLVVFSLYGTGPTIFSASGFKCLIVPLFIDVIVAVLAVKAYDDLHARSVSNPHSPLGQALRRNAHESPAPPPASKAWDGGFEDIDDASVKMGKDR